MITKNAIANTQNGYGIHLVAMMQRKVHHSNAKMQCVNNSIETCRTHSVQKKPTVAIRKKTLCVNEPVWTHF